MKKYLLAASVAALAVSAAHAQTIDFSSLPLGPLTSAVQIGDYLITPALGGSSTPYVVSVGGQKVVTTGDYFSGDDTIVTRVDGGFFNLDSVVIGSTNEDDETLQGLSGGAGAIGENVIGFSLSGLAWPENSPVDVNLGNTFQHVKWVDLDSLRQAYYASFTVSTDASAAVPEPASWALMLGGFGLVGGAMRSRRKAAVSFG